MSSIKDVQYAMNGEPKASAPVQQEWVPEAAPIKDNTPKSDGFVVYKLANSNRKGGVYIPHIDYVIDPRTITDEKPDGDGPEMIRLLKGVTTIWVKEQEKLDKEWVKKNGRPIEFPKGTKFISVPNWDKAMIEFMEVCRHNIRNPHRKTGSKFEFFKYDPAEVAREMYKKELLELEMITKASVQSFEKMKMHAAFLGIALVDELGRAKQEEALRTDYMLAAKRDPKRFKDSLDSKEVDVYFKVRAAIIDNKIDLGRGDGKAYWGKGGGLICNVPKNEDNARFLTNLALTPTTEGKQFLEKLNSIST